MTFWIRCKAVSRFKWSLPVGKVRVDRNGDGFENRQLAPPPERVRHPGDSRIIIHVPLFPPTQAWGGSIP
jgi:hypothetical protein